MKTILLVLLLTSVSFAQDYSPKPTNKEAAVKMHFAIKLFRGVDKQQEDFLVKAIRDRRTISEPEAARLFGKDLKNVFFAIGSEDISTFQRMYQKDRIADKKAIWNKLTKEERIDARRINFAWGAGYLDLTDVQLEFLVRLSKALPTVTKEEASLFEAEAVGLFTKETGTLLFGSIGPYTPCNVASVGGPIIGMEGGSCDCSIGSSFNASCGNNCGPGVCKATEDGCGFAWLYACAGLCVSN